MGAEWEREGSGGRKASAHQRHCAVVDVGALQPPRRVSAVRLLRVCELVVKPPPSRDDAVRVCSEEGSIERIPPHVVTIRRGNSRHWFLFSARERARDVKPLPGWCAAGAK